jgi:hypothetical protein
VQLFDLLMLCQTQLRISPMGHILGFDLAAFLNVAAVKNYPVSLMAELLQPAETGMLEGCQEKAD